MTFKRLLLFFIVIVSIAHSQEMTLFSMQNVPHTQFVNPAAQSEYDWIVGIPGLASTSVAYNNSMFTVDEVLSEDDDGSTFVDIDKAINNYYGTGLLQSSIQYTPLFFGLRRKRNFFSFSITERVNTYNTIPQAAAKLLWDGNGDEGVGEIVSINSTSANAYHLREYELGWSRLMTKELSLGVHLKLMFGKGNLYSPDVKGYVSTSSADYDIEVYLNTDVKTSFPIDVYYNENGDINRIDMQQNIDWFSDYFMNNENRGVGLDFGLVYDMTDRFSISASLLNIGFVNWNYNINIFSFDESVNFDGFESDEDAIGELEALFENFDPTISASSYTSTLVPEVYLGLAYKVDHQVQLHTTFYTRMLRNKLQTAYSISADKYFNDRLNAGVSYSVINRDYFNVGAGVGWQIGMVHLHASGDNLLGFLFMDRQRHLGFRFGISIVPKYKEKNKASDCGCFERWERSYSDELF